MADNIFKKLWVYQAERFPLFRTSLLVLVFSAASISTSAHFAGRALPDIKIFILAFFITLLFFFDLRVWDEIKDFDDDSKYRPERPIPRGLLSLGFIVKLGWATVPLAIIPCLLIAPKLLPLVFFVWLWMTLMGFEFFVPQWLKARPMLYMVSHMAIMPLIDLFVTGAEWVKFGSAPKALILFLTLSFINGCILEIGRKLWSPANEREGVETYSALYGPKRAVIMWMACVLISYCLLTAVGIATGAPYMTLALGSAGLVFAIVSGLKYFIAPDDKSQKAMDNAAGLWVFCCYVAAGYSPFIAGLIK